MNLDNNALLKSAGIGAGAMLVLSLLTQIPLVGLVCCCVLYLGYAGIGAAYGHFARQNNTPVEPGPYALGGALAAGIAGIVQGIVAGVVSLLQFTSGQFAVSLQQLEQLGFDIPPEMVTMYQQTEVVIAAVFFSFCFAIIIGAVLGAIGGAIYGASQRGKAPPVPAV